MDFYPFYELPDENIHAILAKTPLVASFRLKRSCKWVKELVEKKKHTARSSKPVDGIVIVQRSNILIRCRFNGEEDFKDPRDIFGVHFDQILIVPNDPWIPGQEKWLSCEQSIFEQMDPGVVEKLLDTLGRVSCDLLIFEDMPLPDDIRRISTVCRRFRKLKIAGNGPTTLDLEIFSRKPFHRLNNLNVSTQQATMLPGDLFKALGAVETVSLDFSLQPRHTLINILTMLPHFIWSLYCAYLSEEDVRLTTLSMFFQSSSVEDIHDWKAYKEMPKLFPFKTIWDGRRHTAEDEDDLGADSILVYSMEDSFTMVIKLTALRIDNSAAVHVGLNLRVIPPGLDHFAEKLTTMLLGKSFGKHRRVVDSSGLLESFLETEEQGWSERLHEFIENCHKNNRIELLKRIQEDMIAIARMLREVVTKNTLTTLEEEADRLMREADLSSNKRGTGEQ